ncbi:MAG TPA: DUF1501 domain-containing protein, partial [Gemmataceae bacterium]|nr:DUF1501 domain-containing protein [Gemmataceae bacterium]
MRADSASRQPGFGKARSVILVFASGGQSQLDTWDPKPDAPEEIRGAFRSIPTAVSGVRLSEHMPRLARVANLYTLVRSVTHDDLDHGSAAYLALTGQFHPRKSSNPPPRPTDFPTYGAVLHRVRPTSQFPYTAVHLNGPAQVPEILAPGQFGGLLGRAYEPLVLGDVTRDRTTIDGLDQYPDLPPVRQSSRRSLLEAIDHYCWQLHPDRAPAEMDLLYRRAYELLAAPSCREAFNLAREPAALRERYGRNRSGQACLLARRLVEAGVPFVTVIWSHTNRGQDKDPSQTDLYGWDTHNDIFAALKDHLLPRFDQGFSALLEDLEQRGLLEQTLVVCLGEFGRAPRVALEPSFAGNSPGRKHWASVYSVLLAGAGVARGGVVGASDRIGAYPVSNPVSPPDLAATMFWALGIDPAGHYSDTAGRSFPISNGKPVHE